MPTTDVMLTMPASRAACETPPRACSSSCPGSPAARGDTARPTCIMSPSSVTPALLTSANMPPRFHARLHQAFALPDRKVPPSSRRRAAPSSRFKCRLRPVLRRCGSAPPRRSPPARALSISPARCAAAACHQCRPARASSSAETPAAYPIAHRQDLVPLALRFISLAAHYPGLSPRTA